MSNVPYHQIRATYDERTIRVYQAYNDEIADAALARGTFQSPPFKTERMTWIKPSFLWMMYRAGWGYKDRNQCRILAIDISRDGFDWALEHSCGSHPDVSMSKDDWTTLKVNSPVRIQWDPERNLQSEPQLHRSLQVGLGKAVADLYINKWIQNIMEVTDLAHTIHELIRGADLERAQAMLPTERPYPYMGRALHSDVPSESSPQGSDHI